MLTQYPNRKMQPALSRLPAEAQAAAAQAAARAAAIDEIVRLSEPINAARFQSSLQGWTYSALLARLDTLRDESVRQFPGHHRPCGAMPTRNL